jgi:hypothetical protein
MYDYKYKLFVLNVKFLIFFKFINFIFKNFLFKITKIIYFLIFLIILKNELKYFNLVI